MYNRKLLNEIKELTNNRDILKGISGMTGVDYNKPFSLHKITKPFTVNYLVKEFGETNTDMYCFIVDNCDSSKKYLKPVKILQNTCDFTYQLREKWVGVSYLPALCNYYRKSDFNSDRKSNNLAYVLVINKDNLRIPLTVGGFMTYHETPRISMLLDRFKPKEKYSYSATIKIIGQPSNKYITDNDKSISITTNSYCNSYSDRLDFSNILDKSGYLIYAKHTLLENKLKEIQNNKDKIEFNKYIKSQEYRDLYQSLLDTEEDIRRKLVIRLSSVSLETDNFEIQHIDSMLSTLRNTLYYNSSFPLRYDKKQEIIYALNSKIEGLVTEYNKHFNNQSEFSNLNSLMEDRYGTGKSNHFSFQ